MRLVLSHRDVARFRAASEALLSPVAFADTGAWAHDALRRTCELLRCDRAHLLVPLDGRFAMWAVGLPPTLLRTIRQFIVGTAPGFNHVTDPVVDQLYRRRHAAGIRVFSHLTMARIAGDWLRRDAGHEMPVMLVGTAYGFGLRVPFPLGEAHLIAGFSRPCDDPFGVDAGAALLGMLLPAFGSAVGRLARTATTYDATMARPDTEGDAEPAIGAHATHDDPSLPTSDELMSRCHLTEREADVALLLAVGASDREIGWRLDISPHTARKHVEHIFDKLQVHSRKAFALRLAATADAALGPVVAPLRGR